MKKLALLLILVVSYQIYSQPINYNLAGLKSVKLEMFDPGKIMNVQTSQRLLSECKVKLASLGIEVKETNAIAALQFKVDAGAFGLLTNPEVLLRIELLEKVQTFREKNPRSEAKTYVGILLQTIQKQKLNEDCYSLLMDKLFLEFIDQWITDNKTVE